MVTTLAPRTPPRVEDNLLPWEDQLVDDAEVLGAVLSGDFAGLSASYVELIGCRVDGAQLLGSHLHAGRLTDCIVRGCDLAGIVLEACVLTRVEFRECRLSGLQAIGSRFSDVGFVDCRLNDANFRGTTWERAEFEGCDLVGADFYSAVLPGSRFLSCDLTAAQLSKTTLTGSRLQRSVIDGLKGADALRGVTISSDEIIPAALALFGAFEMTIDDEPV
jgi:uncharacterized protein YjbI with pentapeptide repeats